jgi:hypothetical protein
LLDFWQNFLEDIYEKSIREYPKNGLQ